jgi:hypothetical protein
MVGPLATFLDPRRANIYDTKAILKSPNTVRAAKGCSAEKMSYL